MANIDFRKDSKQDINNRSTPAELRARENESIPGYDRQNDGLDDHPISGGDASGKSGDLGDDAAKNIDAVKDAEENPMNSSVTGSPSGRHKMSFKSQMMKKGPLGGIILLLGAGGIGITGLLSPALLLVQITDMFTNNFNDAHAALSVRTNVMLGKKIGNVKNSFAETKDGKCGIKCKYGTMSDTMKRNLEAKGYKVNPPEEGGTKFGRHVVASITLPDGVTVLRNGDDFKKAMRNPANAAHFAKVFNSRTAYFLNSKFGSMLKTKFGINKAFKLAGESKEKFKASFRKALNLPEISVTDTPNPNGTPEQRLSNTRYGKLASTVGRLSTKPTNVVAGACLTYNVSRTVSAAVKVAKYAAFASFAMTFFNAASKLKAGDQGGIPPTVVSELGDRITYVDSNKTDANGQPNELYGKSATDSYGYKAAMYGDKGPMPQYAKNHSLESAGLLGGLASLAFFAAGNEAVRTTAHNTCSGAASPAAAFVQCAPTALTVIGYAGCVLGNITLGAIIGGVMEKAMPYIVTKLVEVNLSGLNDDTKGAVLGDALYPGGAAILGGQAGSYGMKPGTKSEIQTYLAATEDIRKQDEAVAKIGAKDTPLDVYNQYSFLGSMVRNMNISAYTNTSLTSTANLLVSTIPRSIASLTTNTQAGTYMPLADKKVDLYDTAACPSPDTPDLTGEKNSACCPALKSVNADGDGYCMPAYVKSVEEMNADSDTNIDFMINGEYIDEVTGAARTDTEHGKQFQKYLDNCPFRVDAFGETSQSIETGGNGDYEWFIGARCGVDTDPSPINSAPVTDDIKNFRIYAMDEPVNATLAGEETVLHSSLDPQPSSTDTDTTTVSSGNINTNGWTFPTTAGTALVSPFGPRGGGFHTGIDLNAPSGSPFYATKDGVVQTREYNVYTVLGDGGAWCPVLGSMSDPIQKDIWITHNIDGQVYTSVYGHMSKYLKKSGDVVKAGDLIGYTGGSGCSQGPHVHFEIWKGNATPSQPGPGMIDPWPLINP